MEGYARGADQGGLGELLWRPGGAQASAGRGCWTDRHRFSATTDALHRITDESLTRLLSAGPSGSGTVDEGLATLREWLIEGRDGEVVLEALVRPAERVQCGGTSVQPSWSWSRLGLHPLLALLNRSERQLAATPSGVCLAMGDGVVPVGEIVPEPGMNVPSNHVLELAAGLSGGGVQVRRSSRITVVFARKRLQLDESFVRLSPMGVPAGAEFSTDLPTAGRLEDGYRMSIVATPYLTAPRSTIGLGDTFVSGDLLVQANATL